MNLQNLMIMKTLKDLKEFSLDKKQMNQIEGGYDKAACRDLEEIANGRESENFTDADWDAWANRFEEWCV